MLCLCRFKKGKLLNLQELEQKHWVGCNQVSTCLVTAKLRRFQKDLFPVELLKAMFPVWPHSSQLLLGCFGVYLLLHQKWPRLFVLCVLK